jgi:type I restriction enzyme S subunit
MNKYPKYKPSGIDWIGVIPEHWEVERLRYIGNFTSSGIDKKINEDESLVKIVNYTDIYGNPNKVLTADRNYMEVSCPEEKRAAHQVKRGDLVFTPSSETIEDIGLSALVDEDLENTAYSYHVLRFRFNKDVDHSFKKYLCNNHFVLNKFSANAKGTTRQILNRESFNSALVILPTIQEQTAIANFLDEKTEQIDKLISNKQKLIELLKEERTAVINHNVLGQHLIDNGQLTMDNPQLPKHWEVKKLKYLARILSGYSPEQCKPSINNGNIPYIKVDNLNVENPNIDVAKENTTEEFIVSKKPSILFPKRGAAIALNKVAFVDFSFCMDTNLMGIEIFDKSHTNIQFIYYWFKSISLISIADTSTIPQINNKHIEPLYIFLPPLKEQNQIVHLIETETKRINSTISIIEKEIELLQEYRIALISEVVTGKIKVI